MWLSFKLLVFRVVVTVVVYLGEEKAQMAVFSKF